MAHHTPGDRTLALAGVFQAVGLVHQMATRGNADPRALEVCIRSLFETDPPTTGAVFGGVAGVQLGLEWMAEHLSGTPSVQKTQIIKYVVGVLHLERQLAKNTDMLQRIGGAVEKARLQSDHFPVTHVNVLANLAGCYIDTISTLTPRIIVSGEQGYLSSPDVANVVRALLLAAIRSAVLWRQCGGNRIQLLFGRRRLRVEVQRLLKRV